MFSPEKASATVRIPASTQHTNGLFEDYSNVCLCSPTSLPSPSAPTHRPNLHFGKNEEKGKKKKKDREQERERGERGGGRNRLIRIFRKQLESNTTLSCAQTQNGLCRGWPAIQRNNSAPATSIVNPNINNGGEWRVNAWRRILYKKW